MSETSNLQETHAKKITEPVKVFILDSFLPGENPDALTYSTPLISGGIIDSISTLKLVAFLEDTFEIKVQAHEMNAANLDTLTEITEFVLSKR